MYIKSIYIYIYIISRDCIDTLIVFNKFCLLKIFYYYYIDILCIILDIHINIFQYYKRIILICLCHF